MPIRQSRELRPALLRYLDALDTALQSHLAVADDRRKAEAGAELERAHTHLGEIAASAAAESYALRRTTCAHGEDVVRIDAVHTAYLRLTPLLVGPSRHLDGWTDEQIEAAITLLRSDIGHAKAGLLDLTPASIDDLPASLTVSESLGPMLNLRARIVELAHGLSSR